MTTLAILFARSDSIYKSMAQCDVYDKDRNALSWPGGAAGVFHPPCRAWGKLRTFARPEPGEKELALWAIEQVRINGGVLEHPLGSTLWPEAGLPKPGKHDDFGGWTLVVNQHWWGHRAEKATLLYIVGVDPKDLPDMPLCLEEPTHVVQSRKRSNYRPHVSKAEREQTPEKFALWLCELAGKCKNN